MMMAMTVMMLTMVMDDGDDGDPIDDVEDDEDQDHGADDDKRERHSCAFFTSAFRGADVTFGKYFTGTDLQLWVAVVVGWCSEEEGGEG